MAHLWWVIFFSAYSPYFFIIHYSNFWYVIQGPTVWGPGVERQTQRRCAEPHLSLWPRRASRGGGKARWSEVLCRQETTDTGGPFPSTSDDIQE